MKPSLFIIWSWGVDLLRRLALLQFPFRPRKSRFRSESGNQQGNRLGEPVGNQPFSGEDIPFMLRPVSPSRTRGLNPKTGSLCSATRGTQNARQKSPGDEGFVFSFTNQLHGAQHFVFWLVLPREKQLRRDSVEFRFPIRRFSHGKWREYLLRYPRKRDSVGRFGRHTAFE